LRLAVVSDFGLTEYTGGYKRNEEVLSRLSRKVDLIVIPSTRNMRLAQEGHGDKLKEVLRRVGGRVASHDSNVDADLFYVYSNSLEELSLASRLANGRHVGVQLQLQPYYKRVEDLLKIANRGPRGEERFRQALQYSERVKPQWERMIREGKLNYITSVSSVPLRLSGLDQMGLRTVITKPANAFDPEAAKWRGESKEDYAVYFTRLIPEKGLFDVPKIWRMVNSRRDVRLYVMGKFEDPRDMEDFEREVRDLNVEYLGFRRSDELFKVVSKARVVLYPSHFDSFSLVILESLAAGTPVVAFDLLAIREVYGGVDNVRTVPEDDLRTMSEETLRAMREDYVSSKNTEEFLKLHSSWDNVADAELRAILDIWSQLSGGTHSLSP
jgi:glycosyltransferase involved in cell wall biosynthesis